MESTESAPQVGRQRHKKHALMLIVGAAILLLGIGTITAHYELRADQSLQPPASITRQVDFPVYLPQKLPGTYGIVSTSFSYDQGVLLFKAQDATGEPIAFTEQPKPSGFDFASFYSQQLTDAQTLDHVPLASVTGTNKQGYTVLSIVTDKTWVLVSTRAPLTRYDIQSLASAMRLQQ